MFAFDGVVQPDHSPSITVLFEEATTMWLAHRSLYRSIQCAITIALAAACGGEDSVTNPPPPPPPPPSAITIRTPSAPPPRFMPVSATLAVGGTVTWTSGSPVAHDLVATSSNWQLNHALPPGASFQATIGEVGTYRYHCTIHPEMTGTIVVR